MQRQFGGYEDGGVVNNVIADVFKEKDNQIGQRNSFANAVALRWADAASDDDGGGCNEYYNEQRIKMRC